MVIDTTLIMADILTAGTSAISIVLLIAGFSVAVTLIKRLISVDDKYAGLDMSNTQIGSDGLSSYERDYPRYPDFDPDDYSDDDSKYDQDVEDYKSMKRGY